MRVPTDLIERDEFYSEIIQHCCISLESRRRFYNDMRHVFIHGRLPEGDATPFNKVYPHIETLVSFLYSAETTRFSVEIDADAPPVERGRIKPLSQTVNEMWTKSGTSNVVMQAVTWSLVYNSMFIKPIVKVDRQSKTVEITPFMVDPGSIGLYREDVPFMDRQEAILHEYRTTLSQLKNDLVGHPQADRLMAAMESEAYPEQPEQTGMERLIVNTVIPAYEGSIATVDNDTSYVPKIGPNQVTLQELWLWDDGISDYRVVTRTRDGTTIWDRANMYLDTEHPLIQVCPNPVYSYAWGLSEVDGLTGLQTWRNERIVQIRKLLAQQVKPPTSFSGWEGVIDEKADFLMSEEGSYALDSSGSAKVQRHAPEMPPDLFAVISEIDASFAERSGLSNIMMGKGEPGVRSGKQMGGLASLSSARIKKRALAVESSLNKLATQYLKILRKYDATIYHDDQHQEFTADQFTEDFTVMVDAHSSSPIFAENLKADADALLKMGIISKERFVEMSSPPDKTAILTELPKLEEQQQKMAMMQMEMKLTKR